MSRQQIIGQAKLAGNDECKVLYNKAKDIVELEIGGVSLRFEACKFFMMNEILRKAAAKLVMETELNNVVRPAQWLSGDINGNLLKNATGQSMLDVKDSAVKSTQATKNRVITSEDLFAGSREIVIKHAGDEYRLRLTSQGKLILTK